jgi:four helix bundle protein
MSQFRSFEDMQVWQEARELVRGIRAVCKRKNVERDFAFVDQITRSVRSISTNISEGCDAMTNAEFITFLGYSKRSASEVRSHLYDAIDEAYISQEEFASFTDQCKKIQAMLAKLIHHLQSLPNNTKRTFKRNDDAHDITK